MQAAFYDVLEITRCDDPNVAYTDYVFTIDFTGDAVVRLDMSSNTFYVNAKLIREYTWRGFLLIALHECFHIYGVQNASNEEAHELMVKSSLYETWLRWVFGPYSKYLAYVGLENTSLYENLTDEEKGLVGSCIEEFHIKKD